MECGMDFAYLSEAQNSKSETNIIEISLACLKQGSNLATGEPIYCQGCRSILNSFSSLVRTDQNLTWNCEFCNIQNTLLIDDDELPTLSELTYVIESAAAQSQQSVTKSASTIIFCIDISGSMCVTKPVSGILNLKTNKTKDLLKLLQPGEEDQYIPGTNRNLTYVSRLECVKAAIEAQIQELVLTSPNQKVGIVAFNREVRIIGDGSSDDVITGDKLYDFEGIKSFCEPKCASYVTHAIGQTGELLKNRVIGLEEDGPTALGPALLVSLLIAEKGGPGSKVVICTDGLANVGIGSLEEAAGVNFYNHLGNLAAEKGVSVSVISIEGDECRLEALASVTEISGGDLIRVAPENISEQFANMLSNDVIATHVEVEVTLHQAIQFKNEDPSMLSFGKSRLHKNVGNATEASSFSFSYNLKALSELESLRINRDSLQVIPMQAVFSYRSLEGMKCIRVINKRQPVTFHKEEAIRYAKPEVLARAGRRQAAKLASDGRFEDARVCALEWRGEIKQQKVASKVMMPMYDELEADLDDMELEVNEQECLDVKVQFEFGAPVSSIESEERKAPSSSKQDKFVSKMNMLKKKK